MNESKSSSQYVGWRNHDLSRLSLGTAQIGMDYGIANRQGRPDPLEAADLVKTALTEGLNVFETAQQYGETERILGHCLGAAGASTSVEVITKIPSLHSQTGSSIAATISSLETSLGEVGANRFFAVLLHDESGLADWSRSAKTLRAIKSEGIALYTGISIYGTTQAKKALELEEIDVIQAPFNLLDQRALRLGWFEQAAAADKLLMTRSIFLQGLLLEELEKVPKRLEFAMPALKAFHRACDSAGLTALEAALGFAVANNSVGTTVFGAESAAQVAETVCLARAWLGREFLEEPFSSLSEYADERLINPSLWPDGGSS